MEKSVLKPESNIIVKSEYDKMGMLYYVPFKLLPPPLRDKRAFNTLSPKQKRQNEKRLFYVDKIEDVENTD